jgi:ADP-ribosylglycohydrolase
MKIPPLSNFVTTTVQMQDGQFLLRATNGLANLFLSVPQFCFGGSHIVLTAGQPPQVTSIQGLQNENALATVLKVATSVLPVLIGCSFRVLTLINPEMRKALDLTPFPQKAERTLNELLFTHVSSWSGRAALCGHSLYAVHPLLETARARLHNPSEASAQENRAMAALLGLAIGDAQGAPYEFLPWQEDPHTRKCDRFGLLPGQWTDDTSMALCLADALSLGLVKFKGEEGEPIHLDQNQLMGLFRLWWNYGYNNAFRQEPRGSVGLGGNISASFSQPHSPKICGKYETTAGDLNTSGNGAAMRNSPVAIIARSPEEAMRLAWEQSKVTHQGVESALCCQLMAYITYHMIHSDQTTPAARLGQALQLIENFQFSSETDSLAGKGYIDSVMRLIRGEGEWNWKDSTFKFNQDRLISNPGYIGSYVMDGLAMALHCLSTTNSFEKAIGKAAYRGGDADSIAAILGQLAGPIYGLEGMPTQWVNEVLQHDGNGEIACRALVLLSLRDRPQI